MSIHFLQRSNQRLKAMAKSAALRFFAAPSHSFLKVSLVRMRPASSLFTFGKRKKSAWARSHEKGRCSITFTMAAVWTGALSHWNHQSPTSIAGLFCLNTFQELAHGLHDVVGVHRGPPEHEVHVDEALWIEEGQDHLFGPGHMDHGLDRPRLTTLHKPLLALLLSLGCVERHCGLVHGEDSVQHRHGVAAEQQHEGLTDPHPLLCYLLIQ